MHKLGISVHPEHSTPQHNQDYMESAAHYGFTRILAQSQILWEMPFEHMCLLLASKSLRKKYSSSWQPYPCLITVLILLLIPPTFPVEKGLSAWAMITSKWVMSIILNHTSWVV